MPEPYFNSTYVKGGCKFCVARKGLFQIIRELRLTAKDVQKMLPTHCVDLLQNMLNCLGNHLINDKNVCTFLQLICNHAVYLHGLGFIMLEFKTKKAVENLHLNLANKPHSKSRGNQRLMKNCLKEHLTNCSPIKHVCLPLFGHVTVRQNVFKATRAICKRLVFLKSTGQFT